MQEELYLSKDVVGNGKRAYFNAILFHLRPWIIMKECFIVLSIETIVDYMGTGELSF